MWEDRKKHTQIAELGANGLINRLTDKVRLHNTSTLKGTGDDAAVIDCGHKKCLVSTELFLEGIHFDLMYTPLHHLGYKCIVSSISDICAMNATPTQVFVSVGLSNKFTVELTEEIFMGMRIACDNYGIDLAGGDTVPSSQGLVINVTATGLANKSEIVYRNGAKPNDLICVSGDLGGAYLGLHILEREKRIFLEKQSIQPELTGYDYILKRQLRPEARTDIIKMLSDLKIKPTSMIDVSKGLASELLHICRESGTGCRLFSDKLPADDQMKKTALEFNLDPVVCMLNGGEDYELVFTVKPADFKKIDKNPDLTVIGHVTEKNEGTMLVTQQGKLKPLKAQGWDNLQNKRPQ